MNIDIYIKAKNYNREIRIPLLPEEINVKSGDGIFVTYDIMGKGEVAIPTGIGLASVSWESEFPGENWPDPSMIRGRRSRAQYYHNQIESWKNAKTPLNIIVTGYPINMDVYISKYTHKASGPFGSIAYEIEFEECKDIVIKTSTVAKKTTTTTAKRTVTRFYTHVVKSGDSCWAIAQKYYGDGKEWPTIYKANKKIIEQTAKKHGKSSSNNGWWIYPGVRLTIPVRS